MENVNYYTGLMYLMYVMMCSKLLQLYRHKMKEVKKMIQAQNNINKAFNKDDVEFYVYKRRRNGRLEGEITRIVKRNRTEF